MELYAVTNLHNQTVLGRKGGWLSITNSKSILRDVCWFDSVSVAKAACVPYNPNTVTVLTAKNLCKRIGIKKRPGYIQESYRSSVLAETMRVSMESGVNGTRCCKNPCTQVTEKDSKEKAGRRYLELQGCDPSVIQSGETIDIKKELNAIYNISTKWKERQAIVLEMLKEAEAKEQDLLHIIEFYSLKEEQAEAMIQELHNIRCTRRVLKNEFAALTAAIKVTISVSTTSIETAVNCIEKLGTRKYCCRVMTKDALPKWVEEIMS